MEDGSLDKNCSQNISRNSIVAKKQLRRWNTSLGLDMTMLEIEESFINLTNTIDQRVHDLVQRTKEITKSTISGQLILSDFELMKENAEMNWKWLDILSQTIQKHMSNAAEYHLFYQSLLQYQILIPRLCLTEKLNTLANTLTGNYEEANELYHTIRDYLKEYLTWWQNIEGLISQSRTISPIGLRLKPTDIKRPATMLVDYKLDKIILHKDEKVFLTHNETKDKWFVENTHQERIDGVPSICYELSPPDIDAIECALLLRLDLLANCTAAIKEIGSILMKYIATILDHWTNVDLSQCCNTDGSKDNILQSLFTIQSLLNIYWKNSPQLMYLQSKLNAMRAEVERRDDEDVIEDSAHIERNTMFIDISPQVLETHLENSSTSSNSTSEKYILQKRSISILVSLYRELHKYWDNYRTSVDNPSLLSLIENIKEATGNPDEIIANSSDKLMSCLSNNDNLAWSNYLKLLVEKEKINTNGPLINLLPQTFRLQSETTPPRMLKSKIEITVPAEKEFSFHKSNSLPGPGKSPTIDTSQYFTSFLLPKPVQIFHSSREQYLKGSRARILSGTSYIDSSSPLLSDQVNRSSTMPRLHSNNDWNRDVYWGQNRIQPYFMVIALPRADRILAVHDRRGNKSISPTQSQKEGLSDNFFLEILDTDTNIKYRFQDAILKGLISLVPSVLSPQLNRSNSISNDNFTKIVFKIDGIFDPIKDEWINLREAVDRNIVNCRSGQIRLNRTEFCHILNAINTANVRGRRIVNCNIKSLPPEMTMEIQTLMSV